MIPEVDYNEVCDEVEEKEKQIKKVGLSVWFFGG